jgi:hypothetical protein
MSLHKYFLMEDTESIFALLGSIATARLKKCSLLCN